MYKKYEEIKKVLVDLVKIPSVSSDIEKLNEIVNYVENYFVDIPNFFIKKFEFNNKPSLVISNFD
jgi:acetylornithine deacetylase/succinyl-diaminopimelate desuccinylase-like protein